MSRAPPKSEPLYRRAYHHLRARIASGELGAGAMLPSETTLAAELRLSQGTARKALMELERDGLITRRQGRGSFVNQTTPESALFHFFRLRDAEGLPAVPELMGQAITSRAADVEDRAVFGPDTSSVFVIERTRAIAGRCAICETIVVPAHLFPGLAERAPLPNALYVLFERFYGRAVVSALERIASEPAAAGDAHALGIAPGHPVLIVRRQALDLAGNVIERRSSRYHAPGYHYESTLS